MKKIVALIILVFVLLLLCLYVYFDRNLILDLPDYESKVFYTSGGFQDYTDYAKYTFESIDVQDLENSKYFDKITADDIAEARSYIKDFEKWVKVCGDELEQNYDFNRLCISEGDYIYIKNENKDEDSSEKFYNYTIYFFDIDTKILYYFHNNI